MTSNAHMTDKITLSSEDLDRMADHYVKTARRLRSEAFHSMFRTLFSSIFTGIKRAPSGSHTLAGSLR